jgi:RNA polymerase sigma-70 factor (ECF subfamily)
MTPAVANTAAQRQRTYGGLAGLGAFPGCGAAGPVTAGKVGCRVEKRKAQSNAHPQPLCALHFSLFSCLEGGRNHLLTTCVRRAPQKHGAKTRPDSVSESQLVARAIEGDQAAQRALYDAHVDRVYRLAYRVAGDDDLARDFTQEAFIRAFDRLPTFRRESSFGTWLYTITMSVSLNGLRSIKRLRTREVSIDAAESLGKRDRHADPDLKDRLKRAIEDLPPGYRTVFLMHDLEGYTHEEIGEVLGIQSGTSKAQLFRARARLREVLADFAGAWSA